MNHRKRIPSTTTESVLLELFAATTRAQQLLRRSFEGAPMTPDEFAVYSLLRYRGPIAPARFAAALGMKRPRLSNYLARLDERGDLVRRASPEDGRSVLIELSAAGRARVAAAMPHFGAVAQPFHQLLGERRGVIVRMLREVSASLDEVDRATRERTR